MKKGRKIAVATINATLACGLTMGAGLAKAADQEKCYGVVKAGQNGCGTPKHACQGQSEVDGAGDEWILMPEGLCEKIVDGSVEPIAE